MSCRRCSTCGINWPGVTDYKQCPACEQETDFLVNDSADADADQMKARAEFERYYKNRGERDVEIDWSRFNLDEIRELESIPVLDHDPEGAETG